MTPFLVDQFYVTKAQLIKKKHIPDSFLIIQIYLLDFVLKSMFSNTNSKRTKNVYNRTRCLMRVGQSCLEAPPTLITRALLRDEIRRGEWLKVQSPCRGITSSNSDIGISQLWMRASASDRHASLSRALDSTKRWWYGAPPHEHTGIHVRTYQICRITNAATHKHTYMFTWSD